MTDMQKKYKSGGKVPNLRFPEYEGDWEVKKLGEIVKINQGLQIAISERSTENQSGSYFYITNEFLKADSGKKYYILNPPKSVICTEKDILMTRTGNTGQVVTNVSGVFHNNFFKVAYPEYIDKVFLYNFLKLKSPQIAIKEGLQSTPDINKFDKDLNHLIVYDDLVLSKDLSIVENIYIRGRKCGVSCIFISQSYHAIPTMIRKNTNYMIILRLGSGKRELNMVLSEFGMGMTKEHLLAMYEYATDSKFCPLIVHMDEPNRDRKFFKSFKEQLKPSDF